MNDSSSHIHIKHSYGTRTNETKTKNHTDAHRPTGRSALSKRLISNSNSVSYSENIYLCTTINIRSCLLLFVRHQIVFWCCALCVNRWLQSGCRCCCCCFFHNSSKSETCVQSFTWKFTRFSCQLASLCLRLCVWFVCIFHLFSFRRRFSFSIVVHTFATLFGFVLFSLFFLLAVYLLLWPVRACVCAHTRESQYQIVPDFTLIL